MEEETAQRWYESQIMAHQSMTNQSHAPSTDSLTQALLDGASDTTEEEGPLLTITAPQRQSHPQQGYHTKYAPFLRSALD